MEEQVKDRCLGVLFGHAVGDALGLGAECLTKDQVTRYYPEGLLRYNQIIRDAYRSRWEPGEWTDDTDQMLCILDSIIEKKKVDIFDIARRFYQWGTNNPKDIGILMCSVIRDPHFLSNPHKSARTIWERGRMNNAPNGAIMRTSVLGIWHFFHFHEVKENAVNVCRITHYDPRCVGSCVALCGAISLLLQGMANFSEILPVVMKEVLEFDLRILDYFEIVRRGTSLEELDLDERERSGYTLKAMGSAFWALKYANSFEDGLFRIIHEGGDADTNGAVTGALLGAKFGFSDIPSHLVEELLRKDELFKKGEELIYLIDNTEEE